MHERRAHGQRHTCIHMQSHPEERDSFPPRADHAAPHARARQGGLEASRTRRARAAKKRWRRDPGVWPGLPSLPSPRASSPLSSEGTMRRYISGRPAAEVRRGGRVALAHSPSPPLCPFSHSLFLHPLPLLLPPCPSRPPPPPSALQRPSSQVLPLSPDLISFLTLYPS